MRASGFPLVPDFPLVSGFPLVSEFPCTVKLYASSPCQSASVPTLDGENFPRADELTRQARQGPGISASCQPAAI